MIKIENEEFAVQSAEEERKMREDIVNNIRENAFVEAGAGAGKTSLIVNRVVNQIKQGVKPESLVVITFTNKAAGELLERITEALIIEEKNENITETERKNCTVAVENIEQMNISTIHSFCYKLLQQRCFEGGLPLDVSVLENEDTSNRKKTFFEKWYATLNAKAIEELRFAIEVSRKWYTKEFLELTFESICEKNADVNIVSLEESELENKRKELEQLISDEIRNRGFILADMKQFIHFLQGLTTEDVYSSEAFSKKYGKLFQSIAAQGIKFTNGNEETLEGIYQKNFRICDSRSKIFKSEEKSKINKSCQDWVKKNLCAKNTYENWVMPYNKIKEKAEPYAYFVLIKYAKMAQQEYRKTLSGQELSNDELLQRANELLKDTRVQEYFAQRYQCFYVDEFQDTDHIQAELIWNLAYDHKNGKLREGSLFVVGDPKQAIYRFRGGEPSVYYKIKEEMSGLSENTKIYELDNNYRSGNKIISWVNDSFKEKFASESIQYRNMRCMVPENINRVIPDALEEIEGAYLVKQEPQNGKKTVTNQEEAERLAKLVYNLVHGNYGVYQKKSENKEEIRELRRIRYKDFLILCRNMKHMDIYLSELKKLQIPVEMSGDFYMDKSKVLKNFNNLFGYICCPADEKNKQRAVNTVSNAAAVETKEISEERLKKIKAETANMSSRAVVQYLVKHPEYLLPCNTEVSEMQLQSIQANLLKMTEEVLLAAKEDPTLMLDKFVHYVERKQERELSLEEDADVVRFMNVHKAKGLEGTITILVDRGLKYTDSSAYTSSEKNTEGMYDYYGKISKKSEKRYYQVSPYKLNAKTKGIEEKSKTEENSENTRIEYVTATRAKEVFIFFDALDKTKDSFFGGYKDAQVLEQSLVTDFVEEFAITEVSAADFTQILEDRKNAVTEVSETEELQMKQKTYISLSPSMLEGVLEDSDNDKKTAGEDEDKKNIEEKERRPKGNIFGNVMHRSFELLVQRYGKEICTYDETLSEKAVKTCICQSIMENYDDLLIEGKRRYLKDGEQEEEYPEAVKSYLIPVLNRFIKSEKMKELLKDAKEIYTELPFSYTTTKEEDTELFTAVELHLEKHKIEIADGQSVWVHGNADLVVRSKDDTIKIVDYKSDSKKLKEMELFEHTLNRKYEGQMLLYRYSMSKIFGVPLEDVSVELYHLYGGTD